MRTCTKCGQMKGDDEFYLGNGRVESQCKACKNAYARSRYGIENVVDVHAHETFFRITADGYMRVRISGIEVLEHHLVWVRANGSIPPGKHVHHVNGDRQDNRLENLRVMDKRDHVRHHRIEERTERIGDVPDGMKWCNRCKTIKPIDEFPLNRADPSCGRQYWCFPCFRDYQRAYYHAKTKPRFIREGRMKDPNAATT